jgi:hypothetical protein
MSAALFKKFRDNLMVKNNEAIQTSYEGISTRLNKDFWDEESGTQNSRKIGSYGRHTAINGISDLDMAFELPDSLLKKYKAYESNGPSQLLQAVRNSLLKTYPDTEIKGDGQVVVIQFKNYQVEVLPAFIDGDGYIFPDGNNGGTWRITKPLLENKEISAKNTISNQNLRHIAKMLRAWKNHVGVGIGGLLIDTLTYKFFSQTDAYNSTSYSSYGQLFIDLFSYLENLPEQKYYLAPGSNQQVKVKSKFQHPAKKARKLCSDANEEVTEKGKAKIYRKVFGAIFPLETVVLGKSSTNYENKYSSEEFIEDEYPVDVNYDMAIECEVLQNGARTGYLTELRKKFFWLPTGRKFEFFVQSTNVPEPYKLFWKIRNVGEVAESKNLIRGQILPDEGRRRRRESSDFGGEHFVEAYIVKNGICVARTILDVPIS